MNVPEFLCCAYTFIWVIISIHSDNQVLRNKIKTKNYKHSPHLMQTLPWCAAPSFYKADLGK
jgi:hypothetical protein